MDELIDVIPEDPDDCDDFAPDGSLGSMLEEYRKGKQEKQLKLEERAVKDGRPFSAPVASPSCDDIKKRQFDSRALKETPPGVKESRRVVYRPASGPAKLRRSTSEGEPSSPLDMNAHGSGEVEYTLAAVPEEAAAAVGAHKPEARTTPPPTVEQQAAKDSKFETEDIDMDRLRLEDVDELEQDWVHDSHSGESGSLHPEDSGRVEDCEDVVQQQGASELYSADIESLPSRGEPITQQGGVNVGSPDRSQLPLDTAGAAGLHDMQAQPQAALVGYMESVFSANETACIPDEVLESDAAIATPDLTQVENTIRDQRTSSGGGSSVYAVDRALGSIMKTAVSSQPSSTAFSQSAEHSSAGQQADQTTVQATDISHPADGSATLKLTGSMPAHAASAGLQGTAASFSFDDTSNNYGCANSATNYYNNPAFSLPGATGDVAGDTLQDPGNGGEVLQAAHSSTPSLAVDRALGSMISSVCNGPGSQDAHDLLPSSTENQEPAACDSAEGNAEPANLTIPAPADPDFSHEQDSLAQQQVQQEEEVLKRPNWGESWSPEQADSTLNSTEFHLHSDNTESVQEPAHPSDARPGSRFQLQCLDHTSEMGQTGHSDTQMVEDTQPSPYPRPQPCLPRMLSEIHSQSSDAHSESLQHTIKIAPASTASPLPRPAPQLFATASLSEAGTLYATYQSVGAEHHLNNEPEILSSSGVQEPQMYEGPGSAACDEEAAYEEVPYHPAQQVHSEGGAALSDVVPSSTHAQAAEDCPILVPEEPFNPVACLAAKVSQRAAVQAQTATSLEQWISESGASLFAATSEVAGYVTPEACAVESSRIVNQGSFEEQPNKEQSEQQQPDLERPEQEKPDQEQSEQQQPEHEQPYGFPVQPAASDSMCVLSEQVEAAIEYSVQDPDQQSVEVSDLDMNAMLVQPVGAMECSSALLRDDRAEEAAESFSQVPLQPDQSVRASYLPEQQEDVASRPADASVLPLQHGTSPSIDRITSIPAPVSQAESAAQQSAAVDDCGLHIQPTKSSELKDKCSHCGAKTDRTAAPASDALTAGEVLDRLALFACGRMGAEALLQGNVAAALQQLMDAGTQEGMALAASVLRRSVTLTIGQRSVGQPQASGASTPILEILSQVVGMLIEAAKVPDLIPQLLEANWDTVLTEVPRALGPLYQQARSALQQLLHTEECLLAAVQPGFATGRKASSQRQQLAVSSTLPPQGKATSHQISTDANEPEAKAHEDHNASCKQRYMAPAVLAACECGRPVVFGAPEGWEILPQGGHVHARRTVSGKNRARKGGTLSPSIQEHMEEAMQPDGADLEYVYLGPSRGASASPPVTPSRSPMYISSYSPAPGTGFIQDDTPPYAAVDDWSAAPHLVSPGVMGCRTSNTGSARGPRPKTAGARAGPGWDDSPAGIAPRTRSQDGPGPRENAEGTSYRPGSAEPYSQSRYQQNRITTSRMHAPHAWVGTYWDSELSPYVRESFEHAQGDLLANQAARSNSNWLRDQLEHGVPRGGCGWTGDERFQSQPRMRFASHVQGPGPTRQQQQGWEARAAYNLQADDMQAVYTEQLNEMLRYANQCSVMLGSKYRYKAARRRPASAAAGRYRVAAALEGCVERHVVAADGASTVQDPGMIKVMSCAKFMALLEQLAVRVNAVRAIGSGKKRAASQGAKARRRGVGMSGAR